LNLIIKISTIFQLIKPHRAYFTSILILDFIQIFLDFFSIALLIPVLNSISNDLIYEFNYWGLDYSIKLIYILIFLIILVLLKNIIKIYSQILKTKLIGKVRNLWSGKLIRYMYYADYREYIIKNTAENMNFLVTESNRASINFVAIIEIIKMIIISAVSFITILFYFPIFLFLTICIIFIILYVFNILNLLNTYELGRDVIKSNKSIMYFFNIFNHLIIFSKLNGINSFFINHSSKLINRYINLRLSLEKKELLQRGIFELLIALIFVSFIAFDIFFGRNISVNNTEFIIFMIVAILRLTTYFNFFISMGRKFITTLPTFEKIFFSISTHKNIKKTYKPLALCKQLPKKIDKIQLHDISYQINNNIILDNFSYSFQAGRITHIRGKSGSGKSTLIHIILNLLTPDKGNVYLDSDLISDFNEKKYWEYISYLQQENELPFSSVNKNITLGKKYNKSLFNKLLKIFNISKFIDKDLEDFSKNISSGEKQRIRLVQTLLTNKNIIILDEPTNFLNESYSKALYDYLESIKSNKIIIIISHDNYINENSDLLDLDKSY
jgi:ABC-type bacteriocin/lantibiotic exporter with double-glycine peptidase domain